MDHTEPNPALLSWYAYLFPFRPLNFSLWWIWTSPVDFFFVTTRPVDPTDPVEPRFTVLQSTNPNPSLIFVRLAFIKPKTSPFNNPLTGQVVINW